MTEADRRRSKHHVATLASLPLRDGLPVQELAEMVKCLEAAGERDAARVLQAVVSVLRTADARPDLPILATFALHVEGAERHIERIVAGTGAERPERTGQ